MLHLYYTRTGNCQCSSLVIMSFIDLKLNKWHLHAGMRAVLFKVRHHPKYPASRAANVKCQEKPSVLLVTPCFEIMGVSWVVIVIHSVVSACCLIADSLFLTKFGSCSAKHKLHTCLPSAVITNEHLITWQSWQS